MAEQRIASTVRDIVCPTPYIEKETNHWIVFDGEKWVDTGIVAKGKDVDPEELKQINESLSTVQKVTDALIKGTINDEPALEWLTNAYAASPIVKMGLLFAKAILFSNSKDNITSIINGDNTSTNTFIKAGITNFGTKAEQSAVEIGHDGFVRLLNMYFNQFGEDEISVLDPTSKRKILQMGGVAPTEKEMLTANTKLVETRIGSASLQESGSQTFEDYVALESNQRINYSLTLIVSAHAEAERYRSSTDNNNDRRDYGRPYQQVVEKYLPARSTARAWIAVEVFDPTTNRNVYTYETPVVTVTAFAKGGNFLRNEPIEPGSLFDYQQTTQDVKISVPAEKIRKGYAIRLTLHLGGGGKYISASTRDGKVVKPYDTSTPYISVTKDKAALFYGRQKHILLNYLNDYLIKIVGDTLMQGNLTVKGDIKADSITATSGGFYAGGVIDNYGNVNRWVGRKLEVQKISTGRYRIAHNLGHTDYCVQAMAINVDDWNTFVIQGSETTTTVEVGVMWSSSWRNGSVHFSIFAKAPI